MREIVHHGVGSTGPRSGGGFGLIGNVAVGVLGALIAAFVFSLLGVSAGGLAGSIITATVGAALLLFIIGLFKRQKTKL